MLRQSISRLRNRSNRASWSIRLIPGFPVVVRARKGVRDGNSRAVPDENLNEIQPNRFGDAQGAR
jgi:hypothetical protein